MRNASRVLTAGMATPILFVAALVAPSAAIAAPVTQNIKMDYFGYRPGDVKVAIFVADPGGTVQIRNTSDQIVFTVPTNGGSIVSMGADGQPTGHTVWQVDFTPFSTPGTYRLYVPSWNAQSYDLLLATNVYDAVGRAALKTFYYQRCGVAHSQPYAQAPWSDPRVCHRYLTSVTAATGEPDHGPLDLSGGWHDAGDYNKYVWGDLFLAMSTLMTAYESNPGVWGDGQLLIPSGGNAVPDILDEIKVEIDWLLKMQLPNGDVLSRVWDEAAGAPDLSPPSNAVHDHHYYGPTLEATSVFTGSVARFARIVSALGDPYGDAAALEQAALLSWNNLLGQSEASNAWGGGWKLWAAAEVWRMDPTVTSAKSYVETRYADWSTAFLEGYSPNSQAALAYMRTPGANATTANQMKASLGSTVNDAFASRGPFRNSVADGYYHWGSNKVFGSWGALLLEAVAVGATGSHTAAQCRELVEDWLHHFHGQNAMGMTYLTNMAAYGGEHSSFQFFHSWFGAVKDPDSVSRYRGLPPGVIEPDYPYFKGVDNYGVSDNNTSLYGPVPGMVVGGPNKDYSGRAKPPGGATYYERFYRDWIDDSPDGWYRTKVWEITENSISYQGPYVALIAAFMSPWTGTADTIAPSAPTGLAATAVSSSRIDVDWSDNTQGDLFGYNVYRGTASGGPYQLIYGGTTTSAYSDVGLTASTAYYYVVTAVDTSGNESLRSAQASATTLTDAGTMHVHQISNGAQKGPNSGRWIDIYIKDSAHAAVPNATVTGTASGYDNQTGQIITQTLSGATGSDGKVRVVSAVDSGGSFCVTSVTHATFTYDANQNEVTCAGW
jgi:endoglucanase